MATNKNHYETLGVGHDAQAEEIKRAYRKQSAQAHPDREGGSHEAQQALNDAYAVLSDPDRKKRYDAGESDRPDGNSPEFTLVIQLFAAAVEFASCPAAALRAVKEQIKHMQASIDANAKQAKQLIRSLERAEKALKFKGKGESLLHAVLAHKKGELTAALDRDARRRVELTAATKILEDYEAEGDKAMPDPSFLLYGNFTFSEGPR